jgi:tetratricopeptide (TPR) repeat protein
MSSHNEKAAEYLKKSAEGQPQSVQVQFYLALTLMDLGRYEEAGEVFEEVLRIKPDFADGHYMLGRLYLENLFDSEKAISHLKKAEKLFLKLEDYQQSAHVRQLLELKKART